MCKNISPFYFAADYVVSFSSCFLTLKKLAFNLSVSLNVLQASQHLNKHPM